jgi:DNA polymerase-3 subunit delta
VKLAPRQVEGFLRRPPADIRLVLVYGPDAGLVRERIDRLAKGVVDDLSDPFRVADFPASGLREDPARIANEAAQLSLIGGRRVVIVREANNLHAEAVGAFLAEPPGDALVLIQAGELRKNAALLRPVEASECAAAIACYPDDRAALATLIQETLKAKGLGLEREALDYLADNLGSDRLVSRSELDKLALYMGDAKTVRLADAMAAIGDSGAESLDAIATAAATGDQAALEAALARAEKAKEEPIRILRVVGQHMQRLHVVLSRAGGGSVDAAVAALRPPVHFRVADALKASAWLWSARRAGEALERLTLAEIDCKTGGMPADLICRRALLSLAAAARPRAGA